MIGLDQKSSDMITLRGGVRGNVGCPTHRWKLGFGKEKLTRRGLSGFQLVELFRVHEGGLCSSRNIINTAYDALNMGTFPDIGLYLDLR